MSRGKTIRILGSIILVALLVWKVDWRDLGALVAKCDVRYLVCSAILTQALVLTLSTRLYYMILPHGLAPSFGTVCRVTWVGQFFNSCLPGSTGGDIYKIYELCRMNPDRRPEAAAAIVADRSFALLALLTLAVFGMLMGALPWGQLASGSMLPSRALAYASAVIVLLAVIALLIILYSARLRHRAVHLWRLIVTTLRRTWLYFGNAKRAAVVLILAVAGFVILFGAVYFIVKSLNIDVTYLQLMAFMPVLMLAVLLPVTINGHGLREVILIGFFTWLNLGSAQINIGPRECAVAFSLLFVASDFVSVIPGACLYLFKRKRKS